MADTVPDVSAGTALVWCSGLLAAAAAVSALVGRRWSRWLLWASSAAILLATCILARGFWQLDWSYAEVALHSRRDLAAPLRLAGLWSGATGSLLFWTAVVSAVLAWGVRFQTANRDEDAPLLRTVTWGGVLMASHVGAIVAFTEPFARLSLPPVDGAGLVPVLEHPALVWHPPLLYAGLALTLLPWLTGAGGRSGPSPRTGRLRLLALAVLTAGLATGARWAYVELGWGGWWAWDPVENAALVPWLLLLAAVHLGSSPLRQSSILHRADAVTAAAVLAGAAVTRSGSSISVHSFADAGGIGWTLGALSAIVALSALSSNRTSGDSFSGRGGSRRQRGRSAAAVAAWASAGLVALTIAAPLVYRLVTGGQISVGPDFPNSTVGPVAMVAAVLLVVTTCRKGELPLGLLGAATGAGILLLSAPDTPPIAGVLVAAAGGAVLPVTVRAKVPASTRWAHLGYGVLLLGIAGSMSTTRVQPVLDEGAPPDILAGADLELTGLTVVEEQGRDLARAQIEWDGIELTPRRGIDRVRTVGVAESALVHRWWGDIQVALLDADDDRALVRVDLRPLAWAVWLGPGLMFAAGLTGWFAGRRSPVDGSPPGDTGPPPLSDPEPGGVAEAVR